MRNVKIIILISCLFLITFFLGFFSIPKTEKVDVYLEGELYTFRDNEGHRKSSFKKGNTIYFPISEKFLFLDYSVNYENNDIILDYTEYPNNIDLNIKDLNGKLFTNEDFFDYDYTIFINWATWCPDCKEFFRNFMKHQEDLKSKNIQVIGLPIVQENSLSEQNKINNIMKEYSLEFSNIILDDNLRKQVQSNLLNIPSIFVVNHKGTIIYNNQDINIDISNIYEVLNNLDTCNSC